MCSTRIGRVKMYAWYALAICLVLGWAGQKSVNGEPAAANTSPAITGNRPVWYNGPTGTSLVYQQRSAHSASAGESRAFLSPVYYAPAVPPVSVTTTAQPAQAAPKAEKKFDLSTFFDKLKRVNEKYAKRKPTVGTQKQLNEDAEEAAKTNAVRSYDLLDDGGVEPTEGEDRTEWDNNETAAEAINEGRKKFHSHIKFKTKGKKKLSKILYPLIVGLITAKSILLPLFFKAVVVLSKFSFFVSTLSFIISSILGIKVLLLSNNNSRRSNDNTRVEVVHVPLQQKYPTTYSSSHSGWIDRESDGKFIPITGNEGERIIYEKPYSEQEKGLEKDSYLPL